MRKSLPELSVVILCFKSGEFAKIFYRQVTDLLKNNKINYEIVLVGNYWPGSQDITPRVVAQIAKTNTRVISVVKPKLSGTHNMGWDMRLGLKHAAGKYIAIIDGDGQMNATDIPKLFKKIKNGNFDLCKTKRTTRFDGFYRRTVSVIYNLLMQVLFPGISRDVNSKPKVFSREAYEKFKLTSNDWFIDAEIMIKARRLNLKIGEINTTFRRNPTRKSFITFRENFEFIKNMIRWRFMKV